MPSRVARMFWSVALLAATVPVDAQAADWPTYMYDAGRNGVTADGG